MNILFSVARIKLEMLQSGHVYFMSEILPNNGNNGAPATFEGTRDKFRPGEILNARYEILSVLGSGGMGSVYRARQMFLNEECALKTLDIIHASSWRRFHIEAKTCFSLKHPNLVRVYDFGLLENGQPFLVMDLVDGVTLGDRLKKDGPLTLQEMLVISKQVCEGLLYAHNNGVVHRDIKPSNIMLLSDSVQHNTTSVKIVDFGIAKLTATEGGDVQALTRTGEVFGSPLYMSPEQCYGSRVDHRSDIYSLGCVLFEALTGAPPHMGQNALRTMMLHQSEQASTLKDASLGKHFPDELERIVAKMLSKSPDERYQSLADVLSDLSKFAEIMSAAKATVLAPAEIKTNTGSKLGKYRLPAIILTVSILVSIFLVVKVNIKKNQDISAIAPQSNFSQLKPADNKSQSETQAELLDALPDLDKYKKKDAADERNDLHNAALVKSTIVQEHGKPERKLIFPNRKIGEIGVYKKQSFDRGRQAKGILYFDPAEPLFLDIEGEAASRILRNPDFFAKIGRDEFRGLCISLSHAPDAQDRDGLTEAAAKILKNASLWSRLQSLTIKGLNLDAESIEALNNCKNLQYLKLEECTGDLSHLGSSPIRTSLTDLALERLQSATNLDPLFDQFSNAPELYSVQMAYVSVSDSAVAKLAMCGKLQTLHIRNDKFDDGLIDAVLKVRTLRELVLRGAPLSNTQIEKLDKARWLSRIGLTPLVDRAVQVKIEHEDKRRLYFNSD